MNKKKSKLMLIAVIGAIIVLVGAGVVRCVYQGLSNSNEAEQSITNATASEVTQEADESNTPVEELAGPVPDEQTAKIIRGYYGTHWSANNDYNELIFLGDCFIETLSDQNLPVFYTLKEGRFENQQITLDVHARYQTGEVGTDTTITIDHSTSNPTITSDAFTYSHTYELKPTRPNYTRIDNLDEELTGYFDVMPDALIAIVQGFTAEHVPDADAFTWTGEVRTNSADESRVATFKGDDPAATIITVTRDKFGWFSVS